MCFLVVSLPAFTRYVWILFGGTVLPLLDFVGQIILALRNQGVVPLAYENHV